jgi:predicted short-subunit dehydrogenase-like oxidoreductase (DUF2520 family)
MPREGKQSKGKQSNRAADVKTTRARDVERATPARKTSLRVNATAPRTIAVVGAGRLGTALALALADEGCHINALVAQHKAHARRAARLFTAPRPHALAVDELNTLPSSELLLIATPDDRVAKTAARLAEFESDLSDERRSDARKDGARARTPTRIALHTSGALSSDVLAPLRARGFSVGSLHPLVSVSDARAGAQTLRGAHFCIEGDARAVRVARRIVRALGGYSFTIAPKDKALYHAAAVLASGHTVALFELATELLARCGVHLAAARRALLPLTASTLTNLLAATRTAHALTGPFARGDAATVRRNLAALAATGDESALKIYALLGERALRLAERKNITADTRAEIAAALRVHLAAARGFALE